MSEIIFFLPEEDQAFAGFPKTIAQYWAWQASAGGLAKFWGRYHWVLQTFLYLREAGLPVRLSNRLPPAGIIVTHLDCVSYGFRPNRQQTLVILLVDRDTPHPHAHLHVTHNPVQGLPYALAHCYVPPWPQVGLIPRATDRGERFERIAYFGYGNNLEAAFMSAEFLASIAELDLELCIPPPTEWHDFSGVDAVIAVRKFGRSEPFLNKPSLKLFNAWLAGVPAVLGYETAYRHDGQVGVGYLEATTPDELLAGLRMLKFDLARRQAMVAYGRQAVQDFMPPQTVERWRRLIDSTILPMHSRYSAGGVRRLIKTVTGSALERVLWRQPGNFRERPPHEPLEPNH